MNENGANVQLNNALQKWWDSDTYKEIQKSHQESLERAVGKYFMLPEDDRLNMIQAICYLVCKAEREGTSHRGLQDTLGIYPDGFGVTELMDIHNALLSYYHDQKKKQKLNDDLDSLDEFIK